MKKKYDEIVKDCSHFVVTILILICLDYLFDSSYNIDICLFLDWEEGYEKVSSDLEKISIDYEVRIVSRD